MTKTLYIAEKPSVAQTIAKVVGARDRKDGYVEGDDVVVGWCVGHLCELAAPDVYDEKYHKWNKADLPIIPATFKLEVSSDTKDAFKTVKSLIERSDVGTIVCATDAGREGECIFRYVLAKITELNPHALNGKKIMRLWASSLEESALKQAIAEMRSDSDYDALYDAGYERAKSDWLVGINFSRLFSLNYDETLTVGRVQTPTLNLIVNRDKQISDFNAPSYFVCSLSTKDYSDLAESVKIDDKQKADALTALVNKIGLATVTKATTEEKSEKAPALYDLTTLQRQANKSFGYSAQDTLDTVQTLYEAKLVTYPRTDSRYITHDMADTYAKRLNVIKSIYGIETPEPNISVTVNDAKVSDHSALLITETAQRPTDDEKRQNIFDLIAKRMVSAVAPSHDYGSTVIELKASDTIFTAKGTIQRRPGWKEFEPPSQEKKEKPPLPNLNVGDTVPVNAATLTKKPDPPKRYTEDTLLSDMENAVKADKDVERKGLGTPATRASIIEQLIKRGYVRREKKNLLSTEKGQALIKILPPTITAPELTAEWENKLLQVERGKMPLSDFDGQIKTYVTNIVQTYSLDKQQTLFSSSIGTCPICGGTVKERKLSYTCENEDLIVWKTMSGKTLTKQQVKTLLETGKTETIKGFTSKAGKAFDASLQINKNSHKVEFNFDKPITSLKSERILFLVP